MSNRRKRRDLTHDSPRRSRRTGVSGRRHREAHWINAVADWLTLRRLTVGLIVFAFTVGCYALLPPEKNRAATALRDEGYDVLAVHHDWRTDLRCAKGTSGYRATVRTTTGTDSVAVCVGLTFTYRPGHHPIYPWL